VDPEGDQASSLRGSFAARFLEWARGALVPLSTVAGGSSWQDLRPLRDIIGDATVVALSEAVHGGAQPLRFRNRLLQYLVEEMGFTAIALESGIVEGCTIYDYVAGGAGTLATAAEKGISWTFDRLTDNHDLLRWLRNYNADLRHTRKIRCYAFDIPGSPGVPHANRGLDTALTAALDYLARVNAREAAAFHARLDPVLPNICFDFRRPLDAPGYDRLSQAERDAVTATIADLIALLERREAPYQAVSGADDYAWATRAAIGARQVDAWLRQIPLGWQPSPVAVNLESEQTRFLRTARDVRDRAQADNLDWIMTQEGPRGKLLVFAHRYHLSTTPVHVSGVQHSGAEQPGAQHVSQEVLGTYLKRRFGGRLVTIGNLIGDGDVECAGDRCGDGITQTLGRLTLESIEGLAGEVGVPLFLLDLRTAPTAVAHRLTQVRPLGAGRYDELDVPVGKAFDILFYVDTVTPAGCAEVPAGR
jgi:erythromycin esterase